jgi:hypothetical protein
VILIPHDSLALMFTSSRSTIRRAISEVRQLLNQHGTTITPSPRQHPCPNSSTRHDRPPIPQRSNQRVNHRVRFVVLVDVRVFEVGQDELF